ncbi:MAG: O-antigen ligase family protein [Bacteroidetes bacterium]|nr:O-antigen ligase family protein [Bacteroidota bacterium]
MDDPDGSRLGLLSAGELFKRYATDPLRLLTIVLSTVVLGYGARVDNHSPFTVPFLENLVGSSFTGIEVLVALIFLLETLRRLVRRDFWLNRSPVTRPMIWVGIVLGVSPFLRMIFEENRLRIPLEIIETPGVVLAFFLWLYVYRREDIQLMLWLVLIAGLFKSIEGVAIFLSVGLGWGLLTGWRDAMLMAVVLLAIFFSFAITPGGSKAYQNVRRFAFWLLPVAMFTYIGSTRRSFVLGAGAAIVVLVFFFRQNERRRLLVMALPLVGVLGIAATALIGSNQFVDRLGVIGDPTSEGSASYRLIEIYNISNMIAERPIFGWPMGVSWRNYTLLEVENVSPVIPHNTYLYITWRGGFLGLAIWIWVLIAMLRMHFRTIRAARTPYERFLAFWLTAATISVIVAGFTMNVGSDRLKWFYPFFMVMTSYLPGAWPARRVKALRARTALAE